MNYQTGLHHCASSSAAKPAQMMAYKTSSSLIPVTVHSSFFWSYQWWDWFLLRRRVFRRQHGPAFLDMPDKKVKVFVILACVYCHGQTNALIKFYWKTLYTCTSVLGHVKVRTDTHTDAFCYLSLLVACVSTKCAEEEEGEQEPVKN